MKIRTMNGNNLKDPRHEALITIQLLYLLLLVSLMKQLLLGNLNIFSVQLNAKHYRRKRNPL